MPVRSLRSSVLRWPDAQTVDRAVRRWAERMGSERADLLQVGYFGSYARGDWGVGSDLDLVVVVARCESPFERRGGGWDTGGLPVPADLLVYTAEEWRRLTEEQGFQGQIAEEAVWVFIREGKMGGQAGSSGLLQMDC